MLRLRLAAQPQFESTGLRVGPRRSLFGFGFRLLLRTIKLKEQLKFELPELRHYCQLADRLAGLDSLALLHFHSGQHLGEL